MARPLVIAVVACGVALVAAGCTRQLAAVRAPVLRGRSVKGRPLDAVQLDAGSRPAMLVICCVHGNEPAGSAIIRDLRRDKARGVDLWVIPDVNPDGVARDTRQNAHGVDLNRNFPYRWRRSGHVGDRYYTGPRPLSEPESRFAYRVISRLRPAITIWFHQPFGVVDRSGGSVAIERRFARLARRPLERLTRFRGGAVDWQNHRFRHATAFVVELPPGRLSKRAAQRYAHAVLALARST